MCAAACAMLHAGRVDDAKVHCGRFLGSTTTSHPSASKMCSIWKPRATYRHQQVQGGRGRRGRRAGGIGAARAAERTDRHRCQMTTTS